MVGEFTCLLKREKRREGKKLHSRVSFMKWSGCKRFWCEREGQSWIERETIFLFIPIIIRDGLMSEKESLSMILAWLPPVSFSLFFSPFYDTEWHMEETNQRPKMLQKLFCSLFLRELTLLILLLLREKKRGKRMHLPRLSKMGSDKTITETIEFQLEE